MAWCVLDRVGHLTGALHVALSIRTYVRRLKERVIVSVAALFTVHAQCEEPLQHTYTYVYIRSFLYHKKRNLLHHDTMLKMHADGSYVASVICKHKSFN